MKKISLILYYYITTFYVTDHHCTTEDDVFSEEKMTTIYKEMFINYDRRSAPIVKGKPLQVQVRIVILDMVPRYEQKMHFTMDFYLEMKWIDERLRFNTSTVHYLPFDWKILEEIWQPNIYVLETKAGFSHKIPDENLFVFIYQNGEVRIHKRMNVKLFCSMNLESFPFDVQNCNFTMEPYSFDNGYMKLYWNNLTWKKLELLDFEDIAITKSHDHNYKYSPNSTIWSRLYIHFHFRRNIQLFLLRDFLPCIIIVSMSWLSFWVNHRSTPARVLLCILTVLTVVTMTNQVRRNSPSAELFRSIDYYMLFCNLFVFAALGETTLVGMTAPNSKPIGLAQQMMDILQNDDDDDEGDNGDRDEDVDDAKTNDNETAEDKDANNKAAIMSVPLLKTVKFGPLHFYKDETHDVDKFSRIIFPLLFLLFNIVFFVLHLFKKETIFTT